MLQGMAFGVPLGVGFSLLPVRQWVRCACQFSRAAKNDLWRWLVAPEGRALGIMSYCLFILLFIASMASVFVWLGGVVGWIATWDVGYLIWWRRLPSG
jgi:hypothetical protein